MTADPNTGTDESFRAQSCFPPPPRVVPLATAAMDKFLSRPVRLYGLTARQVLRAVVTEHIEATRDRRACIEGMLERLADLRDSLVAKLDALDADPDLEPFLGAFARWDQRQWCEGADDDRECGDDLEPYLSATNHADQRCWSLGGANDLESEHDGREPEEAP